MAKSKSTIMHHTKAVGQLLDDIIGRLKVDQVLIKMINENETRHVFNNPMLTGSLKFHIYLKHVEDYDEENVCAYYIQKFRASEGTNCYEKYIKTLLPKSELDAWK